MERARRNRRSSSSSLTRLWPSKMRVSPNLKSATLIPTVRNGQKRTLEEGIVHEEKLSTLTGRPFISGLIYRPTSSVSWLTSSVRESASRPLIRLLSRAMSGSTLPHGRSASGPSSTQPSQFTSSTRSSLTNGSTHLKANGAATRTCWSTRFLGFYRFT